MCVHQLLHEHHTFTKCSGVTHSPVHSNCFLPFKIYSKVLQKVTECSLFCGRGWVLWLALFWTDCQHLPPPLRSTTGSPDGTHRDVQRTNSKSLWMLHSFDPLSQSSRYQRDSVTILSCFQLASLDSTHASNLVAGAFTTKELSGRTQPKSRSLSLHNNSNHFALLLKMRE